MSCKNTSGTSIILDWLHNERLADTTGECPLCFELLHISDLTPAHDECLDYQETCSQDHVSCSGQVFYRMALSSSSTMFIRCDLHWEMRLKFQETVNERYPEQQPSDFDPAYAGESWDAYAGEDWDEV